MTANGSVEWQRHSRLAGRGPHPTLLVNVPLRRPRPPDADCSRGQTPPFWPVTLPVRPYKSLHKTDSLWEIPMELRRPGRARTLVLRGPEVCRPADRERRVGHVRQARCCIAQHVPVGVVPRSAPPRGGGGRPAFPADRMQRSMRTGRHAPSATLPFYTVVDCRCSGTYTVILLSVSVTMTASRNAPAQAQGLQRALRAEGFGLGLPAAPVKLKPHHCVNH
jgi:hypothetical protein